MLESIIIIVLIALSITGFIYLRRLFFEDWDEFYEAIGFWLTPDLWSAHKGRLGADWWAEFKLGAYIGLCVLIVFIEYKIMGMFY